MSHGLIYTLNYRTQFGTPERVRIFKRDYTGDSEDLYWEGESPVKLNYEGESLHAQAFISTLEINILNERENDDFRFRDVFVADDTQYFVTLEKDANEDGTYVEQWNGFIVPDEHHERYIPLPYRTTFTAIDGLGLLENKKPFIDYGSRTTAARIIDIVLEGCGEAYNGTFFLNLDSYTEDMVQSESGQLIKSALNQVYANTANYSKANADNEDGENMTSNEVLREVLKTFSLHIFKDEMDGAAHFIISGVSERRQDHGTGWVRITNGLEDGTFTEDVGRNIEADKDLNKIHPILLDQDLDIDKAYKEVELSFKADRFKSENIIPNFNWKNFDPDTDLVPDKWTSVAPQGGTALSFEKHGIGHVNAEGGQLIVSNSGSSTTYMESESVGVVGGVQYLLQGAFEIGITTPAGTNYVLNFPWFKMQIRWTDGTDVQWLNGDNGEYTWVSAESDFAWKGSLEKREIELPVTPPGNGDIQIRIWHPKGVRIREFDGNGNISESTANTEVLLSPFSFHFDEVDISDRLIKEESDISYTTEALETEVKHWDGNMPYAIGPATLTSDANGQNVTDNWKRIDEETGRNILGHRMRLLLDMYRKPLRTWSGTVWTADNLKFKHLIRIQEDSENYYHIPITVEFDRRNSQAQFDALVEVLQYNETTTTNLWDNIISAHYRFPIEAGPNVPGETGGVISGGQDEDSDYDVPGIKSRALESDFQNQTAQSGGDSPPNSQSRAYLSDGTDGFNEGDEVIKFTDSAGNTTTNKRFNSGDTIPSGNLPSNIPHKDQNETITGGWDFDIVGPAMGFNSDTNPRVAIVFRQSGTAALVLNLEANGSLDFTDPNNVGGELQKDGNTLWNDGNVSSDGTIDLSSRTISVVTGQSNGVAGLDANGKVPTQQLPNSIMEYKGTWNADTNTPSLSDGTGNAGSVYRVSVAGTHDFGSGAISFEVGDYVIYNASDEWEKSDTTDSVPTVFGRTGNVTAQSGDYNTDQVTEAGNLYFTQSRVSANTDVSANTSARHTQGTDNQLDSGGANNITASTLRGHVDSNSNPHSVTKSQVGLSNVTNDAQLKQSSNLSDLGSASTARGNLGLGTAATKDESNLSIEESQISDLGNYNEFSRTVINSDSYAINEPSPGEVFVIDSAPTSDYTITLQEGGITPNTPFMVGDETGNAGNTWTVTIQTNGGSTINGNSSITLQAYDFVSLYFNGTNFFIISTNN